MSSKKRISILGVTGSIGQSTVDVIASVPDQFDVRAVTANKNVQGLANAARKLNAKTAVIADAAYEDELTALLSDTNINVLSGAEAIDKVAREELDIVMAALMGFAGLKPIIAARKAGTNVAIANKEPLVAAGPLIMEYREQIIPVDSEHNAIFQVFDTKNKDTIDKLILTASGGPFLTWDQAAINNATPEQACAHPNWSMGRKISVDSATMMNKALEIIEAHYLFDMPADKIEVLIHPQSIIHSMVSYQDGSILSQMGANDMRTPIAYALAWPERMSTPGDRLDFKTLSELSFQQPDTNKFPALDLAYKSIELGQQACITLNAANELAVEWFLNEKIRFGEIITCLNYALDIIFLEISNKSVKTFDDIIELDSMIRDKMNNNYDQIIKRKIN